MTQAFSDIITRGEMGRVVRNSRVVLLWPNAVSSEISKHTQAVKLVRNILHVEVESPVWAQELGFYKAEIVNKMNSLAGFKAVKDIRFKAGG